MQPVMTINHADHSDLNIIALDQETNITIAVFSSSSCFVHSIVISVVPISRRKAHFKRRNRVGFLVVFQSTFKLMLRFRELQGHARSGIIHGYGATLHEALTSQTWREPHRCYHMIASVLSFSSLLPPPTHLAVARRNAHVCFVTKCYFGIDKDG